MLKNLKMLREENGISQKQLAESRGVSQQSINKYENHNIEPDIHTMIRIADYFNTSVDFLIGHSEVRRKIEILHAYELNDEESWLIDRFRRLSIRRKHCIRLMIDSYDE